ncbi:MAG: zinc ribbon domain-containing protein [Anaerolineae bacterium]|nr:zinc ribbon domain-containing protein [Anaerolineae bacterium]
MECPDCGFHNRIDARYCGMCGHRLTRLCPVCEFGNPTDYPFCTQYSKRRTTQVVRRLRYLRRVADD